MAWHIVLVLFRPKLCPFRGSEQLFHFNIFLRWFLWALLHHSLTATLALLHMLKSGRREPQRTASRGTRLATQASTTAVNQGTRRKLQQMAKKAANTPGVIIVFKLFTHLNNLHLKNKHRAQQFLNNSCRSSETLFSRFYQHDVIWKRVDTCHLPSAKTEARVKNKESTVLQAFSQGKISIKGKEIESQFITTEKTLYPARDAPVTIYSICRRRNAKHFKGKGFCWFMLMYNLTECFKLNVFRCERK